MGQVTAGALGLVRKGSTAGQGEMRGKKRACFQGKEKKKGLRNGGLSRGDTEC